MIDRITFVSWCCPDFKQYSSSFVFCSGVTILLSLTVFLNMVAETMPATSDAVPLLGTYFNCIMFMVASSVVSTILILNYHHRHADTHEMSDWVSGLDAEYLTHSLI